MADANNVSPLLDEFSLGSPYSSHNGIICCPAIHAVTKEKFILKQISIPVTHIRAVRKKSCRFTSPLIYAAHF